MVGEKFAEYRGDLAVSDETGVAFKECGIVEMVDNSLVVDVEDDVSWGVKNMIFLFNMS